MRLEKYIEAPLKRENEIKKCFIFSLVCCKKVTVGKCKIDHRSLETQLP